MIWAVPLAVAVGLFGLVAASMIEGRAKAVVTRLSVVVFGEYVAEQSPAEEDHRSLMRAAYVDDVYRLYAARVLFQSSLATVAGSILGVYAMAGLWQVSGAGTTAAADGVPAVVTALGEMASLVASSPAGLFGLMAASSATAGATTGAAVYLIRWKTLSQRAVSRASAIDDSLPKTVAFLYALSRSGMSFPTMMRTLAANQAVYGEAARELSVAVQEMNTFGTDSGTALRRVSTDTPSEKMAEFTQNLVSVLGSGQSLAAFFEDQYDRFQEEAESRQQQYLELLSTFAEVYVTVLVAGPLFVITILVVVGIVLQDTLPLVRVIVYAGIPLVSAVFVVYVDTATRDDDDAATPARDDDRHGASGPSVADGGRSAQVATDAVKTAANRGRLAAYDRFQALFSWTKRPVATLYDRPSATFLGTVPIGLGLAVLSARPLPGDLSAWPAALDGPVVLAVIATLGVYTVFFEVDRRRSAAVEAVVPDFLNRLASRNEAGMTIVEAFQQVARSDLDGLSAELDRTRRDVSWGADIEIALSRLESRTQAPLMTQAITLVTNAMKVSGDVGPVLRIAADEARATRQLRRERRQIMLTYLIVIYISFLVFVGIVGALSTSFIPVVESAGIAGGTGATGPGAAGGAGPGLVSGVGSVSVEAYETLFFHAATIQALSSGLIAGQLGEGSLRHGTKHAVILLAVSYIGFLLVGLV